MSKTGNKSNKLMLSWPLSDLLLMKTEARISGFSYRLGVV